MRRGELVTLDVTGGVGGEKQGSRPAVVVNDFGPAVLAVPITDARKRQLPTHFVLPRASAPGITKDSLATCEHAISVDPSRILHREGAGALGPSEVTGVVRALDVAVALAPTTAKPPAQPQHRRGDFVEVDFGVGIGAEPSGVVSALVVSNDTGNYFGRHFLVVPVAGADPVNPVSIRTCPPNDGPGAVDVGLLRVVDLERLRPADKSTASGVDMVAVDSELRRLLHES